MQLLESFSHLSVTEEVGSSLLSVTETFLVCTNKEGGRRAQGVLWLACKESAPFCTAAGATAGEGGSKGVLYLA